MERKSTPTVLTLSLLLALSLLAIGASPLLGRTIDVPGEYGNTIQAAIDAAEDGDVVQVGDGTYTEDIDFLGKAISVIGNPSNPRNVTIHGTGSDAVVSFKHEEGYGSILRGFSITGGAGWRNYNNVRIGGGVFIWTNSSPTLENLIIFGNHITGHGGGIATWDGNAHVRMTDVEIYDNSATGGLYGSAGGGIHFRPNTQGAVTPSILTRVSIHDNHAANWGGAIHSQQNAKYELVNCTIFGNTSSTGAGIVAEDRTEINVVSSIFWGHTGSEILLYRYGGNLLNISYSDIDGGQNGIQIVTGTVNWGSGNINADPFFVDRNNGDFHLQANSPCIDAGDPASDLDPDGTRVDMGAYFHPFREGNFAVDLNGTGYGFIPDNPAYNFGAGNFTVEATFMLTSMPGWFDPIILMKQLNPGEAYITFQVLLGTRNIYFGMRGGGVEVGVRTNFAAEFNTWYHITGRRIGNRLTLTVMPLDGQISEFSQVREGVGSPDNTCPWAIGTLSNVGYAPRPFTGIIDEVRVWNRAITDEEIGDMAWSEPTGEENEIVGLWHFNEGHGTSIHDSSPTANHGTLTNPFTWVEADWIREPLPPDILVSHGSLNWNMIYIYEPVVRSFTITNEGQLALEITGAEIDGEGFSTDLAPCTLQPGEVLPVKVIFDPATEQDYEATLSILSNDPDESDISMQLYGYGDATFAGWERLVIERWDDGDFTNNPAWTEYEIPGQPTDNFAIVNTQGYLAEPAVEVLHASHIEGPAIYTAMNCGGEFRTSMWIKKRTPTFSIFRVGVSDGPYSAENQGVEITVNHHNGDGRWYLNWRDNVSGQGSQNQNIINYPDNKWMNLSLVRNAGGHWTVLWNNGGPNQQGDLDRYQISFEDGFESLNDPHIYWTGAGYYGIEGGSYVDDIVVLAPPRRPDISVSPASLDFGDIEFRRASNPLTLTITNDGNTDLEVTDMSVDDDQFSFDFDDAFTLAPGASRDFPVTFTPNTRGEVEAVLIITSNDEDESPLEVALTGTGLWVSPTDLLDRLCDAVQALRATGTINQGQANSLCVKIANAQRAIDRNQTQVVLNMLNAFVNHTAHFISEDVLTSAEGQPLIDEAQFIASLIQEFGIAGYNDGKSVTVAALLPSEIYLSENYPNPFNAETKVTFGLRTEGEVSLKAFDLYGREVASLLSGTLSAGHHSITWNASGVPAGIYLIRLETPLGVKLSRAVLIK